MGWISSLLGGGIVSSVERIALEYIETDIETAEAKCMLVKVLDPNGKLRRDLSRFASTSYGWYLGIMIILALAHAFGIGKSEDTLEAIKAMSDLFLPITTAWGAIVTASFGVNAVNTVKDK